jgi:hypothetical protein
LRPFIINGSPGIYRVLKKAGFDCFEDLFPVDRLSKESYSRYKFENHKHIVESLTNFKNKDLLDLYRSLTPRLLHNQRLFYEYASTQSINFKFKF